MSVDGARRKDCRRIKRRDRRTWRAVLCWLAEMVERVGGVGGEGRREGGIGRGGAAGGGGGVVDIELHVVWIEAAVVIGGGEVVVRIGDVSEVLGTGRLAGGDGELLLWTAKLVDDDDVDLLKVLDEGVEIVDLEAAARVVATLEGVSGGRDGASGRTSSSSRSKEERALRMLPRSLSMEDESLAHLKSLGLGGVSGARGRGAGLTRGAPGAGRGSSRGRSGCRTSRCARRGGSRGSRSWRASGRAGQQRCMRWAGGRPWWRWEQRARNAGLFSASPPLSRPAQSQPITAFPRLRPRSDHH
jgi:hypothetical protein